MATEKRLIDANELIEDLEAAKANAGMDGMVASVLVRYVKRCPTVDAVEVVHTEWLDIRFDSMWRSMLATCSHCKVRGEVRVKSSECGFAVPDSDYCPHCGAKMDGGSK